VKLKLIEQTKECVSQPVLVVSLNRFQVLI